MSFQVGDRVKFTIYMTRQGSAVVVEEVPATGRIRCPSGRNGFTLERVERVDGEPVVRKTYHRHASELTRMRSAKELRRVILEATEELAEIGGAK